MNDVEVRLRIIEVILPTASRYGMDNPEQIVATCRTLENYVLQSQADETPDSSGKRKPGRPRKGQGDNDVPAFLDPTHGG